MIGEHVSIDVAGRKMPGYVSRPDEQPRPGVILLEGVYGFDDELLHLTDLVAGAGFVGLAINYFHRVDAAFKAPYTPEGFERGTQATKDIRKTDVRADVAAARDWLNEREYIDFGHIATWGFGFGGTMAFTTATLPGLRGAVAFYAQSISKPLPSGEPAPIEDVAELRAPLLLVFGGRDEHIAPDEVGKITTLLMSAKKKVDVQLYPNVGHSFFRESATNPAEIADAWERVQSFLRARFA